MTDSHGGNSSIPEEELLTELHRLAEVKGQAPSIKEMREDGEYSVRPYKRRFGSWSNAVKKAGYEPRSAVLTVQVTCDDIRESIQHLASQLGHVPTAPEMEDKGDYSAKTAQARFGSWNAALRAAGFEPNDEMNISDQRLRDEIRRLAAELGHPPTTNDIKRDGCYSHRPYFRRYDDWESAVRDAGFEPKERPSGPDSHRWKGGIGTRYCGPNWQSQRERVLSRDGFECQMPGCNVSRERHYELYGRDLDVHHIIPMRCFLSGDEPDYDAANRLDNLVSLCVEHHSYWEKFSPLRPDTRD